MQEYVATVKKLDPSWNPQMTEKRGKESKTAFGGPVVSSLYQEETIREEDKNIFDYCRENNIDYVTKAIRSKKVDVNVTDEEGRALLHWACDRGHKELVSVLLQHAADVNSQDGEGQTALHYAAACEFLDIVELLLKSGADPTLRDQEGCLPEEVTDCKAITSALQQPTAGKTGDGFCSPSRCQGDPQADGARAHRSHSTCGPKVLTPPPVAFASRSR
ncbi:acyl-CoA-binding domain-containing protein 6 [Egretta garzetta]|uniref:acyl-CoA-binding domain-containing protein 6 n=1 Tax=Egretta garzetta TaxID=188379 RepID=UPI00163CAD1F|nr:acyl-CoA-binding domain-containing protein 6 [Egretta garzetta]